MAQKNRANMLTDIVSNIYNNLINFITGQNAQDRFVNLLDSSPNILSDASQANGYVSTDANNEMFSSYYNENDSRANIITKSVAGSLVANKFYQINDAVGGTIALQVCAENSLILHNFAIDVQTGEIGTYDITTDVFSPIVSSAQTLAQTLILGNTSGANDIEFDATQGLLFDNASRLREGTIDAGLGGLKGIAQICGAGYELKWENGRLYVMGSSGNTIRQSLYNLTTTPTVTDDDTLGYAIGSLWTLDDGTVYVCSDATTGAAVWLNRGIGAGILEITVGALQTLESNGELSLTTLYIITDSTPYKLMCKAETVSQLSKTATVVDSVYSGTVNFDLQAGTMQCIAISDVDRNMFLGTLPSDITLGAGSGFNQFSARCGNILGDNAQSNVFMPNARNWEFGDNLISVIVEPDVVGFDCTAAPDYDFLYNNAYASTIFTDGTDNYHRYYDPANDRIVLRNLSTPLAAPTYIGGIPDLQQVLDAGNVSTTGLRIEDGAGESIDIKHNQIKIVNASGAEAVIVSPTLATTTNFEIPNKLGGIETFAMLSDVTSLVASVSAGTNISVTGTATNPIINSLADRYKTSSLTSVLIGNGSQTFTVDANLAYIPLQEVLIVYDPSNHMHGTVTSYSGTALVVDVNHHTGSGTFASWVINLDGIPVDAITGVGTANQIAYFTSGQVIASLNTATYPSLTELSYVKGATSAIQTQLNSKVTFFASGADGTASSVTSNTISHSQLIPANTFAIDDVIRINYRVRATNIAAIRETRVYANTTNAIAGAVLVSTASLINTVLSANLQRFLAIKNVTTNTEVITATASQLTDYNNLTTAVSTLAINWTVDQYIIFAVNAGNAADSIRASMYSIEKL